MDLMERSGQIEDEPERRTEYKQNHMLKFNLSSFSNRKEMPC